MLEAVAAQRKANERKQLFLTLDFYGIGFCFSELFFFFFKFEGLLFSMSYFSILSLKHLLITHDFYYNRVFL